MRNKTKQSQSVLTADRLSHAHKSGPMPKVKEALPLVQQGLVQPFCSVFNHSLSLPLPHPLQQTQKKQSQDVYLVLYVVAAKIFLMFSNVSCFWFFMLVPQTFHLITTINATVLSYINLYDRAKIKRRIGTKFILLGMS